MASIIEITNPITGVPEKVDKLDHTAQQIDDAISRALPGGGIDAAIQKKSNPNLLDNWYFGNPVDQRQGHVVKPNTTYYSDNQLTTSAGTTSAYVTAYRYATGTASGVSYASFKLEDSDTAPTYYAAPENVVRGYTGAGYGIDRWKSYTNLTAIIEPDGITIRNDTDDTGYFGQIAESDLWDALVGKTVTMSVLTGNGTLYFCTGTYGTHMDFSVGEGVSAYMWPTSKEHFDFSIASGASIKVSAVKIELGNQQTLAHQDADGNWVLNEIPDYGQELAKCQRYFQLYSAAEKRPALAVDCRPTMRKNPVQGTIAIGGATYYYNNAEL